MKKVLLKGPKFHAKVQGCFNEFIQGEWQKCTLPQRMKDQETSEITKHGTRHKEIKFAVSYLVYFDPLLQNVADIITICDNYLVTKCEKSLL